MRANSKMNQLERQVLARRRAALAYDDHEREMIAQLSDGDILRHLARYHHVAALIDGDPDDFDDSIITQVDALVTAGDLDGAWELLDARPWPAEWSAI
jgi:hypothetical protein